MVRTYLSHRQESDAQQDKLTAVSSSFILNAAERVFIDHMLSYALWELSVQPYLSFNHRPCRLCSPAGLVSSCLAAPALCFLSSPRPAHCTPHTHSHFLCKSPWTPISEELSSFDPAPVSFLPEHRFWPPTFNGCAIFFDTWLYNHHHFPVQYMCNDSIWTPSTETLEGKEHARCYIFWICQSKHPVLRQGVHEEVNTETIPLCFLSMLFLYVVLLEGRRDIRLEKKICREGKIRTQKGCSGGERRNGQIDKVM